MKESHVFGEFPPDHGNCVSCGRKIQCGDRVYVGSGWLAHLDCRIASAPRGSSEAIAQRLIDQASTRFCLACLAASLGLTIPDVKQAISQLTLAPTIHVEVAPCANCKRRTLTVSAEPSSSEPPLRISA